MVKVKNGDIDKLGLLYERYHQRLFGFFYRLTFRHDVSEDLVQGVFERILKYRVSYTAEGDFTTWIFTVARNHFHDYYRKNDNDHVEIPGMDWNEVPDEMTVTQNGELAAEKQNRLMVQQALKKLDPDKREVLMLSRFEGFLYSEIAEIMQCTEGAVKVRAFRAINELKGILKELKEKENYD